MNVLIPLALLLQDTATPEGAQDPGGIFGNPIILVVALLAIFYLTMLGPERKQRKKREEMLNSLKKGQEVMTTGGMYGKIAIVQEDKVTLEISNGVRVKFSRSAIQGLANEEKDSDGKAVSEKKSDEAKTPETVKA